MLSPFTLAVIVQRLNLDEAFSCGIDLIKYDQAIPSNGFAKFPFEAPRASCLELLSEI